MRMLETICTAFPEVFILKPIMQNDNRGIRYSVFVESDLLESNISFSIKQDSIYRIAKPNTIYGIHFQNNPKSQGKLIGVLKGSGKDYIVDLRKDSKTYKKWICLGLDDKECLQILVPKGFGHLFLSSEADTILQFRIDEYFDRDLSRSISYQDPEICLDIMASQCICSEQDRLAPFLSKCDINL